MIFVYLLYLLMQFMLITQQSRHCPLWKNNKIIYLTILAGSWTNKLLPITVVAMISVMKVCNIISNTWSITYIQSHTMGYWQHYYIGSTSYCCITLARQIGDCCHVWGTGAVWFCQRLLNAHLGQGEGNWDEGERSRVGGWGSMRLLCTPVEARRAEALPR